MECRHIAMLFVARSFSSWWSVCLCYLLY